MSKPRDNEPESQVPSEQKRDDGKYAPHLLLIRQTERLDEAMALGRDPYPAFCAWQSALDVWAVEDPIFMEHAERAEKLIDDTRRRYGIIPRLEYVRVWRPLYFGLMRRMGLFDGTAGKTGTRDYVDLGLDR